MKLQSRYSADELMTKEDDWESVLNSIDQLCKLWIAADYLIDQDIADQVKVDLAIYLHRSDALGSLAMSPVTVALVATETSQDSPLYCLMLDYLGRDLQHWHVREYCQGLPLDFSLRVMQRMAFMREVRNDKVLKQHCVRANDWTGQDW
jgi:hypothetical protein